MYGMLSQAVDPAGDHSQVFGIPAEYSQLREQLAPIPRLYDEEGRLYLPPKNKRDARDTRATLTELIGHSPDEADALVMALYALRKTSIVPTAGVAF